MGGEGCEVGARKKGRGGEGGHDTDDFQTQLWVAVVLEDGDQEVDVCVAGHGFSPRLDKQAEHGDGFGGRVGEEGVAEPV